MDRLVLTQSVTVEGRDFLGRKASMLVEPCLSGWWWRVGSELVELSADLLKRKTNRLVLQYGKKVLNVVEHFLALRFTGLDGIIFSSKTSWLPYDGSASLYWNALKPFLKKEGELENISFGDHIRRCTSRGWRSLRYSDLGAKDLRVSIFIDYPKLGKLQRHYAFPSDELERIIGTKSQGWPPWRLYAAKFFSFFGWPHKQNIVWPQEHPQRKTLELFADHRALDLLGALSVIIPRGKMLAGIVTSNCGGHELDVELAGNIEMANTAGNEVLAEA